MRGRAADSGTGFWDFLRAFGASWLTLMSGPLTVPLAILAVFVPGLYKLLFALLAVACGFFSSYRVWRNERERAVRSEKKAEPPFAKEKLQEVEGQYRALSDEQKAGVKKLLLAGRMTPQQMSSYLQDVAHFPGASDVLSLIEGRTTLVKRDFTGYYEITPDLKDALAAYLADK